MRKLSVAVLASTFALFLVPTPAVGIIQGAFDGNAHPNVGMIFGLEADGAIFFSCTGTLIAPDVVLTAAHCLEDPAFESVEKFVISFDAVVQIDFDRPDGEAGVLSPYIAGEPVPHPLFEMPLLDGTSAGPGGMAAFKRAMNYDIGVLLLEQPAAEVFPGIEPAPLAEEGTLDRFVTGTRNTYFLNANYGVQQSDDGGMPFDYVIDGRRMKAQLALKQLTDTQLILLGNYQDARGEGGSCFGDSGSPVFLGEEIVSLFTWVGSGTCNNTAGGPRIDAPIARDFLDQFVELP